MIRLAFLIAISIWPFGIHAEQLRLAVTTSFQNSGLSDLLLPRIREDTGIEVQLLVVGSGQALRLGQAGDVDAILVHSPTHEKAFIHKGFGLHRQEIMYNSFGIVGPIHDPANVGSAASAEEALARVARQEHPFVSRGDYSGTHEREIALWQRAGITPSGAWFRSVGAGMGSALNTASAMNAYILVDRGSWLNFKNKQGLALLYESDQELANPYSYIPINADVHSQVRLQTALKLEAWLVSPAAAELINGYRIEGEQLFVFSATER